MQQEQQYLNFVFKNIENKLEKIEQSIKKSSKQIEYLLGFISQTFTEMDAPEMASTKTLLEQEDVYLSQLQEFKQKLMFQKQKAYFARLDFTPSGTNQTQKVYIGRGSLIKQGAQTPLVSDWRAPISSMFYDYEIGPACYQVEGEIIEGRVQLKRQYKLSYNKLEYFFDTSIMVYDEILQKELSQNTSGQMKTIVATIQKEQNQIIRDENHKNLIVQGVAGSGKTAIALHRIAYLLYKHKNLVNSNQVVILSPNNLFSHYIGNVLPELGEKNVAQTTFYQLAKNQLGSAIAFETRSQMLERILQDNTQIDVVNFKESFDFLQSLNAFLKSFEQNCFKPKNLKVGKKVVEAQLIKKLYFQTYANKAPSVKLAWITDYVLDEITKSEVVKQKLKARVQKLLYAMFVSTDILRIYREFLHATNLPDLTHEFVNYEDLAPLMHIKHFLFGLEREKQIKHLVIDEMQDFSPIALQVLDVIFACPKTILGDVNQTIYKKLSKDYLDNLKNFLTEAQVVRLKKSYRSTKQITKYSADVLGVKNILHINRDGQEVQKLALEKNEVAPGVVNFVLGQKIKGRQTAVICATEKQAQQLFVELSQLEDAQLLTEQNQYLPQNSSCLIMSVAMAKGLEFDAVVYINTLGKTNLGKQLLYVASTRALHQLCVINLK